MNSSTIYTIGTALNRAHQLGLTVEVLVEGQWLAGSVIAVDGHGVVLTDRDLDHSVVRLEQVAAVRVLSTMPGREPSPRTTVPNARPMPTRHLVKQGA